MAGNSLVDARLAPVVVLLLGFLSNPSLSAQVATGSIVGTVESGRGILYGPGHTNFDTSLSKRFSVGGRANAEFRWDVFNLFNHPGFGFPNAAIGNATVGRITTTILDNRSMQFALKVNF
jgi:hypothetical protein